MCARMIVNCVRVAGVGASYERNPGSDFVGWFSFAGSGHSKAKNRNPCSHLSQIGPDLTLAFGSNLLNNTAIRMTDETAEAVVAPQE